MSVEEAKKYEFNDLWKRLITSKESEDIHEPRILGRNEVFKSKFNTYLLGEAEYSPLLHHINRVQSSVLNRGEKDIYKTQMVFIGINKLNC